MRYLQHGKKDANSLVRFLRNGGTCSGLALTACAGSDDLSGQERTLISRVLAAEKFLQMTSGVRLSTGRTRKRPIVEIDSEATTETTCVKAPRSLPASPGDGACAYNLHVGPISMASSFRAASILIAFEDANMLYDLQVGGYADEVWQPMSTEFAR